VTESTTAQFSASNSQDWKYVTKSNPCALCGKPDWCSVSPDGNAVLCRRTDYAPPGWKHIKNSTDGHPIYVVDKERIDLSDSLPYSRPQKRQPLASDQPKKDYTVDSTYVQHSHSRLTQHQGKVQSLALNWLDQRGFDPEMIRHYQLGLEQVLAFNPESGHWETYWGIAIFIPVPSRTGRFHKKVRVAPWLPEKERPDYLKRWSQLGVSTTVFTTYRPEDPTGTYFCEGEWDAMALGWVALKTGAKVTIACSTGGCGTMPKPEQMEPLPKPVIIFYDHDQPDPVSGRRAGEYGAKRLANVLGADGFVGQVPMPHGCTVSGWDVSNALSAGYTWSDFEGSAAKALGECFAIVLHAEPVQYNYDAGSKQQEFWEWARQKWQSHQQQQQNQNSEPAKKSNKPTPDVLGEELAEEYRSSFAFNNESRCWMRYEADFKGVWSPETEEFMESVVHHLIKAKGIRGFLPIYTANVLRVMRSELFVRNWDEPSPKDLVPFSNGVLEIATQKLLEHSPGYRFTWSLPRVHNPDAKNWDTINAWMDEATGGDVLLKKILLCWYNAVLKGRSDLHKFLHLVGPGGTGKGTSLRLCVALIGERNTCSTNLIDWNQNRFEPANAYRKRLVVFFDEDKYSGPLGNFKRLTGGDYLRGEEKGKKAFNYIFDGMTAMASNFPVFAGDVSSGMARRPIVTPLTYAVPKHKVKDLDKLFAHELDALTNYVLGISDEEVTRVLRQIDGEVSNDITRQTWEYRMRTDSIAAWINDYIIREADTTFVVGDDKDNLDTLFGHYFQFCTRTNSKPKGSREFTPHLLDLCNNVLGWSDVQRKRTSSARLIQGLRLRRQGYDDHIPRPIEALSDPPKSSGLSPRLELALLHQSAEFWSGLIHVIASEIVGDVSVTPNSDGSKALSHKDNDGCDGSNQVRSNFDDNSITSTVATIPGPNNRPPFPQPEETNQKNYHGDSNPSHPSQTSYSEDSSRHADPSVTRHSSVTSSAPPDLPSSDTMQELANQILLCQTWVAVAQTVNRDGGKLKKAATSGMTKEQRSCLTTMLATHLCDNPSDLNKLTWVPVKLLTRALEQLTFTIRRLGGANVLDASVEFINGCKFVSVSHLGDRYEQWVFSTPEGNRIPVFGTDEIEALALS